MHGRMQCDEDGGRTRRREEVEPTCSAENRPAGCHRRADIVGRTRAELTGQSLPRCWSDARALGRLDLVERGAGWIEVALSCCSHALKRRGLAAGDPYKIGTPPLADGRYTRNEPAASANVACPDVPATRSSTCGKPQVANSFGAQAKLSANF